MTKPVTYYAQSKPIDLFVEKYGSALEQLTKSEKLFLQALISEYLSDGLFAVKVVDDRVLRIDFIQDAFQLIQSVAERDLYGLSMAIASQLYDKVYAP